MLAAALKLTKCFRDVTITIVVYRKMRVVSTRNSDQIRLSLQGIYELLISLTVTILRRTSNIAAAVRTAQ
jgi:energy-coupling factor transporter transmembrane protein EcfT